MIGLKTKNRKPKTAIRKTVVFIDEGSSNSDNDKIMARMDSMTLKMDAQYKEMKEKRETYNNWGGNHSTANCKGDDTPMSREEEAKFMQSFRRTLFYDRNRDRDRDKWCTGERSEYNRDQPRSSYSDENQIFKNNSANS